MRRFHPQNRGLKRVHPEIRADEVMVVLGLHPVRPQQPRFLRQRIIVGGEQPGIAEGAEILAREEREASEGADRADRLRFVSGANGLRGVLDHRNAGAICRGHQRIEIGAEAEQMDRHDRLRPRRDRGDGLRGIDVEREGIDVDQHGTRSDARDAACRREKRVGRRDDFVARADAERHEREQQRVGARRDADGVLDAEERGQFPLEAVDLRPHDEALAVGDARHCRENVLAQWTVLRLQIEQGHLGHDSIFYLCDLIAARVSRSASRRRSVSRLSYNCLPFARLTATFTRPSLK